MRERAGALDIVRVGENVVARTQRGASTRILLGGHLDTVPSNDNATPRVDGDTLHGLGAADMKGGLAVLLVLAELLARSDGARDVTLVFYEGEEVADEHNGLRRLFAERPHLVEADVAVLLEPTGGWIEAGCQGTIHVRVTFRGARAHSARPWMGVNAVHRAAPTLARVAAHEAPSRSRSYGCRRASPTTSCPIVARSSSTGATHQRARTTTQSPKPSRCSPTPTRPRS